MATPTSRLSRGERTLALLYAAVVAVMWPSPLFGLLHVESAAVVAGLAFFGSGLLALAAFRAGRRPPEVLARSLGLLVVPWALLTVSLLWRANCGYLQGLALFLLFAAPSVTLAVATAWVIGGVPLRRPRLAFVLVGLLLSVAPVLDDLGMHPQFYTYNPVWGGVLGPIYDEELAIRPGLFAHRALMLLWASFLLALGTWFRTRQMSRTGAVVAMAIGVVYLFAPALGIVTTECVIERRLDGRYVDGPFVLHFDPTSLASAERVSIGETLRYRHSRLTDVLGVAPGGAVHVYIYPDPETRADLIGSRYTSVAPVWLRRPQIHLLEQQATPEVLGHELVHVFAREFGMPVVRASPAIGLVEGLAVALEPPSGLPAPAEQVAASLELAPASVGGLGEGPAVAISTAMDPVGFWTGRGAVSYATAGAFVEWLLRRHGPEPLREAYRTGRLAAAYGRPTSDLAAEWARDVARVDVTPEARALAAWSFSQPSLLERRCPHHVPREERLVRRAGRAWSAGDAGAARRAYEVALAIAPAYLPALVAWAAVVAPAAPREVAQRLGRAAADTADAALLSALGDARRLAGDDAAARRSYRASLAALPPFAHESRAALALRTALPADALALVLSVDDPGRAAAALEAHGRRAPSVLPFAAARWAAAGDVNRARAAIRSFPEPADPELAAARLAWRARYARLAGRHAEAARESEAAGAAYRAAGLVAPARQQDDRAAEARWLANRR